MTINKLTVAKYAHYMLDKKLSDIEICKHIGCTISDLGFWKIENALMEPYCILKSKDYPWIDDKFRRKHRNIGWDPSIYKWPKKDDNFVNT